MTDKSKKQVKHEKHSYEKKQHGHKEISKKDLGKIHGGSKEVSDIVEGDEGKKGRFSKSNLG